MSTFKKIAIMGAGALGGYFGGRAAAAGADVAFVARGAHLKALQEKGLKVESPMGDFHLQKITATDNPGDIGPVDLILFLVKLFDTEAAARQMAPMVGPNTAILSLQNGIDPWDTLKGIYGNEKVLGGIATLSANIKSPGVIRHTSTFANIIFGEFNGVLSKRVKSIEKCLAVTGQTATAVEDIGVKIWEKFIFLTAFSGLTALTRLPIGKVLEDRETNKLFTGALEEVIAVGRENCPGLPDDVMEKTLSFVQNLPYEFRSSLLNDLTRGKKLEIDQLSGTVARLGKAAGIATPVHTQIHVALSPFRDGDAPIKL